MLEYHMLFKKSFIIHLQIRAYVDYNDIITYICMYVKLYF